MADRQIDRRFDTLGFIRFIGTFLINPLFAFPFLDHSSVAGTGRMTVHGQPS
jgi:hypothetical protein